MQNNNSLMLGSVYQTKQGLFCVDPRDQVIGKQLIETGSYGQGEIARMSLFLREQSKVLMLGGHIGSLAVPLSRKVSELTVFEANPDTYRLLKINLEINQCANVRHYNLAANDKHGELQFVMNTVNSGGSKRMPIEKDNAFFYDNPEVRTIAAIKLDDLLLGKSFDLIFMDIEGSEYFAMRGMPKLIEKATILVSEFLPHHLSKVAGISVDDFLDCLSDFKTMIVPSLQKTVYKNEMHNVLSKMYASGIGDAGLIFHKENIVINFKPPQ